MLKFLSVGLLAFAVCSNTLQHSEIIRTLVDTQRYESSQEHDGPIPAMVQPAVHVSNMTLPPSHRPLKFVHIAKTGGTSIEAAAAEKGIAWGRCHFEDSCVTGSPSQQQWKGVPKSGGKDGTPFWHLPPEFFTDPVLNASFPHNPYGGADLFAVVRNPYERVLSEYYYFVAVKSSTRKRFQNKKHDAAFMNKWISRLLRRHRQSSIHPTLASKASTEHYHLREGHLIPQYNFIFGFDKRQLVKHVIKYERLSEEFDALMQEYGLPIQLPQERHRESGEKKLGATDLTLENLKLIEDVYQDDFREFGYPLLSSTSSHPPQNNHP